VASGALTADVSAEVERLRVQHADAVREKSAAESKSRRLAEKVAALEGERTDLRRQLVEERREANQAIAEAQAEAKLARAEGSLASQRAEDWEGWFNALHGCMERAEASTHSEVERTRTQLVDSYRELGAWTADFEVPNREAGLRFLEWLQEELLALPTIVEGFMSFASLVTCEGAMNALSREGCRHYEVFDQTDESFEREIFKAEGPVVKQSVGALFDRMWGAHGCEAVRERSDRAREQVTVIVFLWFVARGCVWCLLSECVVAADGAHRGRRGLRRSKQRTARGCGGQTGATLGCW
jgi:SpoVK/Ycf46/Vps4 family AAA+-type ATPase